MVKGVEDLRTPLSTILSLEREIRGSIAGFMMPSFVVDLPGGGGKRLAASYESYDPSTGLSQFVAPAVKGTGSIEGEKEGRIYEYWDPLAFTKQQVTARQKGSQQQTRETYEMSGQRAAG
jgi:lysine 2,3-aminomutase